MWTERFRTYLAQRLRERHEITSVEEVRIPGGGDRPLTELRVARTDGTVFSLRIVRSSPGGEDYSQPEVIVTKDELSRTNG